MSTTEHIRGDRSVAPDAAPVMVLGAGPAAEALAEAARGAGIDVALVGEDGLRADLGACAVLFELGAADDAAARRGRIEAASAALPPRAALLVEAGGLPVTELAAMAARPERVAGVHFVERGPGTRVAELIAAETTAPDAMDAAEATLERLQWPVVRTKDRPGFLVDRLHLPFLNQVIQAYDDGLASAEDIDASLVLGLGHRIGALELLDQIGLDVHRERTARVHAETGDGWFAPPPLLHRLVSAGRRGAGRGGGFREEGGR